jgi:probable rRNA maturation factor
VPERGLGPWLARVAPAGAHGTVTLALAEDRTVRRLNRRYRHKDRATDVLAFPAFITADGAPPSSQPHVPSRYLGDIVIARGVAARQARRRGHSVATEMRVLALHGLLHLLGYDHERDNGEMARLEAALRARHGLR